MECHKLVHNRRSDSESNPKARQFGFGDVMSKTVEQMRTKHRRRGHRTRICTVFFAASMHSEGMARAVVLRLER